MACLNNETAKPPTERQLLLRSSAAAQSMCYAMQRLVRGWLLWQRAFPIPVVAQVQAAMTHNKSFLRHDMLA